MKIYTIKYEGFDGVCRCTTLSAFDKQDAISKVGAKMIYWIK